MLNGNGQSLRDSSYYSSEIQPMKNFDRSERRDLESKTRIEYMSLNVIFMCECMFVCV